MAEDAAARRSAGAEFVGHLTLGFGSAAGRVGRRTLDLSLGSSKARLVFAGDPLFRSFGSAFEHLVDRTPPPDFPPDGLTVHLWDSASSGVEPPKPPWSSLDYLARGEVSHDFGDGVLLSFRIDSGVLSVFEPLTNTAVCWVRDPALLPPWELAAPLRPVLAWWAEHTGRQLAHGAAVGTPAGAVLLAGRGGSGKSTTALACLEAGFLYLGDDYVMLEQGDPPRVSSLYSTAKLVPANLDERLSRLRALVAGRRDPTEDKVTLSLWGAFGDRLSRSLPLRAIVIPSISSGGRMKLQPITAASALSALAPTTLFQLPNAGAKALERLARIIASVPRYQLQLDRELDANVRALGNLIEATAEG